MSAWRTPLMAVVGLLVGATPAEPARVKPPELWGVAYGAFRPGQSPLRGIYPSRAEIAEDMRLLRGFAARVRTYSVNETQALIPRLARRARIECYAGAHVGSDRAANATEIETLLRMARRCAGIVVGNEVLLHGSLTPDELRELIVDVKGRTRTPVGYADVPATFLANPALVAVLDFLFVHVHPYWECKPPEAAAEHVHRRWLEVRSAYPDKRVIVGETGWPSQGEASWCVAAGEDGQRRFLEDLVALALAKDLPYFWFQAFDEPWKQEASGIEAEAHWGLWSSSRAIKPRIGAFFSSPPPLVEIRRPARCGAGPRRRGRIAGRVHGFARDERDLHRVVVYAGTDRWYVQPFVASPLTRIRRNLSWTNRTHLGERYAALLVREGYLPSPTLEPDALPGPDGDVLAVALRDCR